MSSPYGPRIRDLAPGYDARHVEAFMRVEHSTLDWMSPHRFAAEVDLAVQCVKDGGLKFAESIALSFGL